MVLSFDFPFMVRYRTMNSMLFSETLRDWESSFAC